jgi:P27 family predicted phage terminase small subunit
MPNNTVPTRLKLLRGNPGHRPIEREPEPIMAAGVPAPPDDLDEIAAAEWRRIAPEVFRLKLLTIVDTQPLAAYCQAFGRWIVAERGIATMAEHDPKFAGLVARNEKGNLIQNPLVVVSREAARDMVKYAGQFGLTPVSRARLAIGPAKPASKFDGLLAN